MLSSNAQEGLHELETKLGTALDEKAAVKKQLDEAVDRLTAQQSELSECMERVALQQRQITDKEEQVCTSFLLPKICIEKALQLASACKVSKKG